MVGGGEGEQVALSTHADTGGASSTHSSAVSLELFMVIVLSAFLSVPREAGPEEDDPHFLKAKCSVLISRNEQPVTWVNLLDPGRFIVSCHS